MITLLLNAFYIAFLSNLANDDKITNIAYMKEILKGGKTLFHTVKLSKVNELLNKPVNELTETILLCLLF